MVIEIYGFDEDDFNHRKKSNDNDIPQLQIENGYNSAQIKQDLNDHVNTKNHHINDISQVIGTLMGMDANIPQKNIISSGDNGSDPHGYKASMNRKNIELPALLSLDNRELYQKLYEEKLNDSELLRRNQNPPSNIKDGMLSDGHIAEIWAGQRKKYSYEGDCRHDWEKFLDLSFAEQVKTVGDMNISSWPEENPDVQKAKARIAMMTPTGINRMAAALNGKDIGAIMKWGAELNRQRAEVFKVSHGKTIREVEEGYSQIKGVLADYENMLRAQPPTGIRGFFAKMIYGGGKQKSGIAEIELKNGKPEWAEVLPKDYRFYTPQQKMARGEIIIDQIEDYYSEEIVVQLERYIAAEERENLARQFKELTSLYVSALKRNRTRLIEEGAKPHTIDNHLSELGRDEAACDEQVVYALTSGVVHEKGRKQMRGILDVMVPAFRTQMKTAYLQALSKQALTTEFAGKALGGIIMDKARAREFADNLNALADQVRDLAGLQQAMSNNEILVLEHKQPLALEYKPLLALPAPSDYVQE